jgi:hypothetical protein
MMSLWWAILILLVSFPAMAAVPGITAPAVATVVASASTPLPGISIAETGAGPTLAYTVTLTDAAGLLSATGSATITGSGTTTLTVHGTSAQVNSSLANLTDVSGSDQIAVNAVDANSNAATPVTIPVRALPSTNTYLVYSTAAAAHSRAQMQCAAVRCDGVQTVEWWNVIGPLGAGTAGSQSVADGSYAVELRPGDQYYAPTTTAYAACAVGCGLSGTEQSGLVTAVQIAPLLTSVSGTQFGSVSDAVPQ